MIETGTIVAYVDGELDAEAAAAVEAAARADPAIAEAIEAHRRLRETLFAAFAPIAEEPVPDRLVAAAQPPAPVVSLDAVRARRRPLLVQAGALAACLVAAVGITLTLAQPQGDFRSSPGGLMAQGQLAHALSSQLASEDQGATRIGLTFRDKTGAVCRTFSTRTSDGLACRSGDKWRIDALARNEGTTEFRQAASPLIMSAAEDRMAGDAFDAGAEKAARDRNWR